MKIGIRLLYASGHELQWDGAGRHAGYESRLSSDGRTFYVWKPPVPRIEEQILDCVVYLYPSIEDAEAGKRVGGTGFLVGVPSEVDRSRVYLYAVTNSHVIREGQAPVIRLNTKEGKKVVLPLTLDEWVHHPDGDDVAVCPFVLADPDAYGHRFIPQEQFLTEESIQQLDVGPGDDVYMVGRFVSHEGRQRNIPIVRFGNISMMPWEAIRHERGIEQESFLLEMRSLSGFSGSPVFLIRGTRGYLLGVDWAHMASYEEVKKMNEKTGRLEDMPERFVVKSNSGQMAAVPVWKLQELLDQEDLVAQRKQHDRELEELMRDSHVVLDVRIAKEEGRDLPTDETDAFTQDDFEDALDRVSRRESSPDPES